MPGEQQTSQLWRKAERVSRERGIPLTPEKIDNFLEAMEERGCVTGTLDWYRRGLNRLYQTLPEDKCIQRDTLAQWKESLLHEGYAPRTINIFLVAADGYLEEEGAREYQIATRLKPQDTLQPEMSRAEYVRLLQSAKAFGKERVYLLVKLFALTGFPVQELPLVTVEAVNAGKVTVESNGVSQIIRFPQFLREELLAYCTRKGILSGPVFLSRDGSPMSRTNVSTSIRRLCAAAQVPEEKGNPRCLKRLFQSTRADIEANIALLVEQALERKMEEEQLVIGWEERF